MTRTVPAMLVFLVVVMGSNALGFVAARRPERVILQSLPAKTDYILQWWDIDEGQWQGEAAVTTDATGAAQLPTTPDKTRSWAFRLLEQGNGGSHGGDLIDGTPRTVEGGSENVSLGNPPNTPDQDWVVLLRNI